MTKIIFYFSGTGNSFAVSRAIANKLRETELAPISQIRGHDIEEYETVGFVFPVYYIHAPEIVIKSLNNVKLNRSQQVFIFAAHGASYGYALSDVKCQLSKNNDVVIQEFRVNMPGNYILEYGANPFFYQKNVLIKAEKKIEKIVDAVLLNKPRNTKEFRIHTDMTNDNNNNTIYTISTPIGIDVNEYPLLPQKTVTKIFK